MWIDQGRAIRYPHYANSITRRYCTIMIALQQLASMRTFTVQQVRLRFGLVVTSVLASRSPPSRSRDLWRIVCVNTSI